MASVTAIPFNFQPVSTTIETAGYTPASGKYAYVVPKHWNCAIDGDEVCIVKKEARTNTATGTSTSEFVLHLINYPEICMYDNINVNITRSSGTRGIDSYFVNNGGILVYDNSGATTQDFVFSHSNGATTKWTANYYSRLLDNNATSVNRDINTGIFSDFANANSAGTLTGTIKDYFIEFNTTGTASSSVFVVTTTYYKVFNEGFWIEAGQVLTGDRWIVTEYNKIS
jgi:hypothetical protein